MNLRTLLREETVGVGDRLQGRVSDDFKMSSSKDGKDGGATDINGNDLALVWRTNASQRRCFSLLPQEKKLGGNGFTKAIGTQFWGEGPALRGWGSKKWAGASNVFYCRLFFRKGNQGSERQSILFKAA